MADKSGYNATMSLGAGYTGASLKNVTVSMNGETIDVSNLASKFRSTTRGLTGWEVTGTKGVTTEVFLDLMEAAASAGTSVSVTVTNPAGTAIWTGTGWYTAASLTYPMGAAEETVTITGNGGPTVPA